ncbi:MAG: nucleotidyl transferase AbiEii/AbiGii toxin family protein [Deltaproteobacteria bacterium]|nr:nucleotidyl transferase AbiEii/AbiGii toxin family protein [Deltaproteobacteria bacterium]
MDYKDINNRLRKIAKQTGRIYFEILYLFLMERFLARLSNSEYADRFVLKGGFLMIKRWAPYSRTTRDLDFVVQKIPRDDIVNVLNKICSINLEDGIEYLFDNSSDIMTGDVYEGVRFLAKASIGEKKLQERLRIDVGFSDTPVPPPQSFIFKPEIHLIEGEEISVLVYGKESIIAEKIESLVSKSDETTRMRDIYDIWKLLGQIDNYDVLQNSIKHVFEKRSSQTASLKNKFDDSFIKRIKPLWNIFITKNRLENLDIDVVITTIQDKLAFVFDIKN